MVLEAPAKRLEFQGVLGRVDQGCLTGGENETSFLEPHGEDHRRGRRDTYPTRLVTPRGRRIQYGIDQGTEAAH